MRRVLTIFIILAVLSITIMIRDRRSQGPGDLAQSLVVPSAIPISDRLSLSAAAPSRNVAPLNAADTEKLHILGEILRSKNDNDPRLDRELRELSDSLKQAIIAKYRELPSESRNERGTVVLLIGRNLSQSEDFNFLADVLREPPCLSLANCKATAVKSSGELGTNGAMLAYPQQTALRFLERSLGGPLEGPAVAALQAATKSPDGAVAQRAAELLRRVGNG